MPICRECNKEFPNKVKIDGKWRNIRNRARCLDCQPFGEVKEVEIVTKVCKYCENEFVPSNYRQKFCNHSCSASFNNAGVSRASRKINKCLHCGNDLNRSVRKYCSNTCMQNYLFECKFENFLMFNELPKKFTSKLVKRILLELYGNVCQKCGILEWNGKDITLDLEHIDGHSENNSFLNLTLLCPNCHSQTSTYKGKNKGNGRHSRRERYRAGKSY